MKLFKAAIASIVVTLMTTGYAYARSGFGIGVIVGDPTGLSLKFGVGSTHGVDFAASWNAGRRDSLYLHADYLFHNYGLLPARGLSLYYGIGARTHFFDTLGTVGLRIPLGVDFVVPNVPLNLFAEVVPVVNIVPSTHFDVDASAGIRFVL